MTTRAVPAVGSIEADRSQPVHTRPVDKPRSAVRVGVIGYGYWGPNIVRNLSGLEACELAAVCDKNPAALKRVTRAYPGVHATTEFSEVLRSPDIDAVAIVTPVWTHFELAKAALEHGKHVFVEKPFTSTNTCLPCSRAAFASSKWVQTGVTIATASMSGDRRTSENSVVAWTPG